MTSFFFLGPSSECIFFIPCYFESHLDLHSANNRATQEKKQKGQSVDYQPKEQRTEREGRVEEDQKLKSGSSCMALRVGAAAMLAFSLAAGYFSPRDWLRRPQLTHTPGHSAREPPHRCRYCRWLLTARKVVHPFREGTCSQSERQMQPSKLLEVGLVAQPGIADVRGGP